MTKEERTDIKVGATVLVAIALLLFGILWAKGWHFGPNEVVVRAIFPTAGGIEKGDPVMVSGIKRGLVREVLLRDTGVMVTMGFDPPVDLRRDASAKISMLELMSGKKVEIDPGVASERLPAGAIMYGVYSGDVSTLVAMVNSLSATLQSVTVKADTLFTSLNSVFRGDSMKTQLSAVLVSVDQAAKRATAMLAENGTAIRHTFSQADTVTRDLSAMLSENRAGLKTLIDTGSMAVGEARTALIRASNLAVRFDSLLASANKPNTMLYRLTKDEQFATRLDSTVSSLLKLMEQLRLQGLDANIRFFNSAKPGK
ncbi:MAG: MlaD family protein [Bacteroidota bacterium]|nr:MlaD family protein [Bacteroidota bacterium]MDP4231769.1 MlaD family protein [Bacteroidota bacterium]MDP4243505.1 MlaD family protein [Bacteroidota bacterium]MDP4287106.1 MlaD family protein [Bacteroidota bacterium]